MTTEFVHRIHNLWVVASFNPIRPSEKIKVIEEIEHLHLYFTFVLTPLLLFVDR